MPEAPALAPRKPARQSRSRETVNALVEATARLLVRQGFERTTTNRIAEAAGVSVGSLYQYFPGKEALAVAVIERHKREIMQVLDDTLVAVERLPLRAALRKLIAVTIEAHRAEPELHRAMREDLPRSGRVGATQSFDRRAYDVFRDFLGRRRNELREVDLDLAAYVCVRAVDGLIHGAVLERPDLIEGERLGAYVDEVTLLVERYLR